MSAKPEDLKPTLSFEPLKGAKKRNRGRDLTKAITLRPKDIFALYGIPDSTLCVLCKAADESKRPPSILIPGRKGRRGIRLFEKDRFEKWYREYRT
jgi:hypothetical protein